MSCVTRIESLPDSVNNKGIKDDLLLMPAIESMQITANSSIISPKGRRKIGSESMGICSGLKMLSKKAENIISSDECESSSKNPLKKRILHTFIQPDGCIVGYIEEVNLKEENKNFKKTDQDNSQKDSLKSF